MTLKVPTGVHTNVEEGSVLGLRGRAEHVDEDWEPQPKRRRKKRKCTQFPCPFSMARKVCEAS